MFLISLSFSGKNNLANKTNQTPPGSIIGSGYFFLSYFILKPHYPSEILYFLRLDHPLSRKFKMDVY